MIVNFINFKIEGKRTYYLLEFNYTHKNFKKYIAHSQITDKDFNLPFSRFWLLIVCAVVHNMYMYSLDVDNIKLDDLKKINVSIDNDFLFFYLKK